MRNGKTPPTLTPSDALRRLRGEEDGRRGAASGSWGFSRATRGNDTSRRGLVKGAETHHGQHEPWPEVQNFFYLYISKVADFL